MFHFESYRSTRSFRWRAMVTFVYHRDVIVQAWRRYPQDRDVTKKDCVEETLVALFILGNGSATSDLHTYGHYIKLI